MARRPVIDLPKLRLSAMMPAPREATFRAWTDPDAIVRWWGRAWGVRVPYAEVDLRVGGDYRIVMKPPIGGSFTVVGTYREVEPPERLVYTLAWEREEWRSGKMLVTVEFREQGEKTEIVLTHERCGNSGSRVFHSTGWRWSLRRLQKVLAGR